MAALAMRPERDGDRRKASSKRVLQPHTLAMLLARWAFQHEKVLEKLDLHAALAARRLARRCENLAQSGFRAENDMPWGDPRIEEWLLIRSDAAELLASQHRDASAVPREACGPQVLSTTLGSIGRHQLDEGEERGDAHERGRDPIRADRTER